MAEPDEVVRALERALRDPELRALLGAALASRPPWWERHRQFVAGLASGAVLLLAFLIPSLQDQWDRWEGRATLERYAAIGRQLAAAGHYGSAEAAFGRALDLSEGRRLDLLQAQLEARVQRVNEDPEWRGAVPETLTESDFVYLLEMQAGAGQGAARAATLAAFGAFLASHGRLEEAGTRLREAAAADPRNVAARVNLGNLLSDEGRTADAEREYRIALGLAPEDGNVVYDLATLLAGEGRCAEALPLLEARLKTAPEDGAAKGLVEECGG